MTPPIEPSVYRFSEAPIWELQRAYYEEQGIKAWQNEEVPQFITSNPMIAKAYAEMVFGFLQDRARLGESTMPVTLVELGAGSGRLAFLVLRELCELIDIAGAELPPVRYIMTDLAVTNVSYWQQHPSLAPYAARGILDFATFDAVQDTELELMQSGKSIKPGDLEQPLLIIANYFFDSIPQELIYVDQGQVFDCKVSLTYPSEGEAMSPTERLEQVTLDYHYYRDANYDSDTYPYASVMKVYKQKLEDSHILFPAIGIACLERLRRLSRQGFLLLTADKGDNRLESWEFSEPPKLIVHGSFSLTANYHAIQTYFEQKGALAFFTSHHHHNLNVGSILWLQDPQSYVHTRLSYRRVVERFGPDDFFSMKQWADGQLDNMELRQILAFWRLGGYDEQWLMHSSKRISSLLEDSNEADMEDIKNGIITMWESYYPLGEKHNLALECAKLLYRMDMFADALVFFERASTHSEPDAEAFYLMAICCYEAGNESAASDYTTKTLALEPEHEGALALLPLL